MNGNVLQKCIDALKQETPDLSYVRGMLETLLDMQQQTQSTELLGATNHYTHVPTTAAPVLAEPYDEATANYLRGGIGKVTGS